MAKMKLSKGVQVSLAQLNKNDTFRNKGSHYVVCQAGNEWLYCFCFERLKMEKLGADQKGIDVNIHITISPVIEVKNA